VPGRRPDLLDRAALTPAVVPTLAWEDMGIGDASSPVQGPQPRPVYFKSFTVGSVVVVVGGAGSAVTLLPVPLM
jgi:hypothetical protein